MLSAFVPGSIHVHNDVIVGAASGASAASKPGAAGAVLKPKADRATQSLVRGKPGEVVRGCPRDAEPRVPRAARPPTPPSSAASDQEEDEVHVAADQEADLCGMMQNCLQVPDPSMDAGAVLCHLPPTSHAF